MALVLDNTVLNFQFNTWVSLNDQYVFKNYSTVGYNYVVLSFIVSRKKRICTS